MKRGKMEGGASQKIKKGDVRGREKQTGRNRSDEK